MGYNTNKAILRQYIAIGKEFEELYDNLLRCKSKYADIQAIQLTGMPKGNKTNGDIIGSEVAFHDWISDMDGRVQAKLCELENIRIHIETAINNIQDSDQRRVLRLRYFDGYNWETIACKINYSWAQTHRIHYEALRKIVL